MPPEKVREVGALYRELFTSLGVPIEKELGTISLGPSPLLVSNNESVAMSAMQGSVTLYRKGFSATVKTAAEFPHDQLVGLDSRAEARAHLAFMLPKIELFIADSRLEKVYRWLGFIKGAQWAWSTGPGSLIFCRTILSKMESKAKEGDMAEAFYWLGFIQGSLWATGIFTIQQLKEHNLD